MGKKYDPKYLDRQRLRKEKEKGRLKGLEDLSKVDLETLAKEKKAAAGKRVKEVAVSSRQAVDRVARDPEATAVDLGEVNEAALVTNTGAQKAQADLSNQVDLAVGGAGEPAVSGEDFKNKSSEEIADALLRASKIPESYLKTDEEIIAVNELLAEIKQLEGRLGKAETALEDVRLKEIIEEFNKELDTDAKKKLLGEIEAIRDKIKLRLSPAEAVPAPVKKQMSAKEEFWAIHKRFEDRVRNVSKDKREEFITELRAIGDLKDAETKLAKIKLLEKKVELELLNKEARTAVKNLPKNLKNQYLNKVTDVYKDAYVGNNFSAEKLVEMQQVIDEISEEVEKTKGQGPETKETGAPARAEELKVSGEKETLYSPENQKIIDEIKNGNIDNIGKLTQLFFSEAILIVKIANDQSISALDFSNLSTIDHETAAELAKFKGSLSLNGLTTLDNPEIAEALAKHKGNLYLNNLTTLDNPEIAEALAKNDGSLSLNGLTTLDNPEIAEALAKHYGSLSLNGLTTLDNPEIAEALAKHYGSLYNLEIAEALAKNDGSLSLNGLTTLDNPEIAEALAKLKVSLSLNGLTTLDNPEIAKELATHKGSLSLNGLTVLDDLAVAGALFWHEGDIYLNGLTTINSAIAAVLTRIRGDIHIESLDVDDEEVIKILSELRFRLRLSEKMWSRVNAYKEKQPEWVDKIKALENFKPSKNLFEDYETLRQLTLRAEDPAVLRAPTTPSDKLNDQDGGSLVTGIKGLINHLNYLKKLARENNFSESRGKVYEKILELVNNLAQRQQEAQEEFEKPEYKEQMDYYDPVRIFFRKIGITPDEKLIKYVLANDIKVGGGGPGRGTLETGGKKWSCRVDHFTNYHEFLRAYSHLSEDNKLRASSMNWEGLMPGGRAIATSGEIVGNNELKNLTNENLNPLLYSLTPAPIRLSMTTTKKMAADSYLAAVFRGEVEKKVKDAGESPAEDLKPEENSPAPELKQEIEAPKDAAEKETPAPEKKLSPEEQELVDKIKALETLAVGKNGSENISGDIQDARKKINEIKNIYRSWLEKITEQYKAGSVSSADFEAAKEKITKHEISLDFILSKLPGIEKLIAEDEDKLKRTKSKNKIKVIQARIDDRKNKFNQFFSKQIAELLEISSPNLKDLEPEEGEQQAPKENQAPEDQKLADRIKALEEFQPTKNLFEDFNKLAALSGNDELVLPVGKQTSEILHAAIIDFISSMSDSKKDAKKGLDIILYEVALNKADDLEQRYREVSEKFDGKEYEAKKKEYDPIHKFCREKLKDDPEKHKFKYFLASNFRSDTKNPKIVKYKKNHFSNYHDFLVAWNNLNNEDQRYDGSKFGKDERENGDISSYGFVEHFEEGGKWQKFKDGTRKLQADIKDRKLLDEYSDAVLRGEVEEIPKKLSLVSRIKELRKKLEAPKVPPVSEREKTEGISHDIVKKFAEAFNLTAKDLEKIEGFNQLSHGQQQMAFENLRQIAVGRIEEAGIQKGKGVYEKYQKKELVYGESDNKAKKAFKWLWNDAINTPAHIKFVGKNIWNALVMEKYVKAEGEKESAEEMEAGGLKAHGEILTQLTRGLIQYGPDVEEKDGQLIIKFIRAKNIGDLSDDEKKKVESFNTIAHDFSQLPSEWADERSAKAEQYKAYSRSLKEYKESLAKIASVLESKSKSKEDALTSLTNIDSLVRLNQFINSNPEAEKYLADIKSRAAWRRGILQGVLGERLLYFGAGFAGRTAAISAIGIGGVPLAAATMAAFFARYRAHKQIKEVYKYAKKGQEDTQFRSMEQYVDAENFIESVNFICDELGAPDEQRTAKNPSAIVELFRSLNWSLSDIKGHMDSGTINFGAMDKVLFNQYELIKTISRAEIILLQSRDMAHEKAVLSVQEKYESLKINLQPQKHEVTVSEHDKKFNVIKGTERQVSIEVELSEEAKKSYAEKIKNSGEIDPKVINEESLALIDIENDKGKIEELLHKLENETENKEFNFVAKKMAFGAVMGATFALLGMIV
ncbi:MAG: hypothetical protein PHU73_05365, partial [Patescibacteria group bacterium]|nr:hypothetical protein [Patescibacteria group bacterium]